MRENADQKNAKYRHVSSTSIKRFLLKINIKTLD